MRYGWFCAPVMALAALASTPSSGASPQNALNCAIRSDDCAPMLAAIEAVIPEDRLLNSLRTLIDQRLAVLAATLDPVSAAALEADEAVYRSSLHRDLAFVAEDLYRDTGSLYLLAERLATRLVMLDSINPAPAGFDGQWVSATGNVTLEMAGDGFAIVANTVEPNHLAWTCEFDGIGHRVGPVITAEAAGIDHLELQREGAALRVVHTVAEGKVAWSCGANGSLSGVYFRVD